MIRRISALAGAVLLVVIVGSCHDSGNTVTGPRPLPAVTPTPMPPGAQPTPTPMPPGMQTATVDYHGFPIDTGTVTSRKTRPLSMPSSIWNVTEARAMVVRSLGLVRGEW